jgi:hypothetical protein
MRKLLERLFNTHREVEKVEEKKAPENPQIAHIRMGQKVLKEVK